MPSLSAFLKQHAQRRVVRFPLRPSLRRLWAGAHPAGQIRRAGGVTRNTAQQKHRQQPHAHLRCHQAEQWRHAYIAHIGCRHLQADDALRTRCAKTARRFVHHAGVGGCKPQPHHAKRRRAQACGQQGHACSPQRCQRTAAQNKRRRGQAGRGKAA